MIDKTDDFRVKVHDMSSQTSITDVVKLISVPVVLNHYQLLAFNEKLLVS